MVAAERETTPEFTRIDNKFASIEAVLHRGARQRSRNVVLYTHPRTQSNLAGYPGPALARRGTDVLSFNNRFSNSPAGRDMGTVFEELALDVAAAVQHARDLGYEHAVLTGNSAGGPTMAYYQNVAENGNRAFSPLALSKFSGFHEDGHELRLPPADGLILRSITLGTAASFLIRLDASVIDEASGARDPSLDMYAKSNGFSPADGRASYSSDFLARYWRVQAARMNRIIAHAEHLDELARNGTGRFGEGEVIVIPRTRANPETVDLALARQSMGEHRIHPDGHLQRVTDVRPVNLELEQNESVRGAAVHWLDSALSYRLVRVDEERFNPLATTAADSGIDFASSNSSTPFNLSRVSAPLLLLQGTADESNSVKLPTAELMLNEARSPDKTLEFVAGGMHSMRPVTPEYGDTRAIAAAVMANWISERFGD